MPSIEEIKKSAGHNYLKDTGKRLWEPVENSFKRSGYATRSCSEIYHMETTEAGRCLLYRRRNFYSS